MRVIVTGGTGMIGSKLVDRLVEKGYDVVVLTRSPQKYTNRPSVNYQKWDTKTAAGWGHFADGAFAVINLAGESIAGDGFPPDRWTDKKKQRILNSRIQAGEAVTQAFAEAEDKPKVLIQAAAIGYYGDRGSETLTESSAPGSDFFAEVVKQWEASTATVEEMDVRRVVTRTGVVFSEEGGALEPIVLQFKLFAGGPLGSGEQYVSWVHIDDVVKAMLFLLENEAASGPINVTAPNPVTNAQLAKQLGQVMNRPSFMPAPAFALRLALGEVADVLLNGQKVLPARLKEMDFDFKFEFVDHALRDLLN